ncbi:MAG: SUMF1/EgtB/PvdO family nonheme iron enzyme, partial [Isosphaeraceae bacterium]
MRGDKPDPRDDVYALGVIWYQLLTGDLTTPAPTGRRWVDELLRQGMSDAAVELLSSCFERNPAHRPDDAGVLADRLDTLPRSASAKPADAATELPIREGEAPSEPVLRRSAIDREGEAPSEPVLRPGDKNRKGDARMEPASPPGTLTPIPARTEPRPPGALQAEFVPRGQRPQATAISARSRPGSGWSGVSQRWVAAGLLGLAGLLGVIVYIATDKGTIKITGSDPRMTVRIDGRGYRIENLGQPITFQAGQHELVVKRDGLEFKTKSFQIRRGMETVLDVTYTEDDPSGAWPPKPPDSRRAETNLSTAVPSNPESHAEAPAPSDPESITTRVGQIKLKRIPAGKFLMGSPDGDGDTDEHPQHEVRITRPFYLGVTEVTRGQFRLFVDETGYKTEAEKDGKGGYGWNEEAKKFEQSPRFTWQNPGFEQTDEHPVVNVTWNDAQEFVKWLSQKEGRIYRLPTEAEWEYACRAGTKTAYVSGDDAESLAAFGNIADGTAKEKYPEWTTIAARDGYVYTAPVGRFRANAFGLYDMHGNVWEWCQDWYDAEYYKQSPGDDPRGP